MTIVGASAVLDINVVVKVTDDDGTKRYTIEEVSGPNHVDGYDLYFDETGAEMLDNNDGTGEALIDAIVDHYNDDDDKRALDSLLARARGFVTDWRNER